MSSPTEEVAASDSPKENETPAGGETAVEQSKDVVDEASGAMSSEKSNIDEQAKEEKGKQPEQGSELTEATPPTQQQPTTEVPPEDKREDEKNTQFSGKPGVEAKEAGGGENVGAQGAVDLELAEGEGTGVAEEGGKEEAEKTDAAVPDKEETEKTDAAVPDKEETEKTDAAVPDKEETEKTDTAVPDKEKVGDEGALPLSGILMKRGPKPLRLWQKRYFAFRDEPYEVEQLSVVFKKNVKRPFIADLIKKKDNLMARIEKKEARVPSSTPKEAAVVPEKHGEQEAVDVGPDVEKQSSDLETAEKAEVQEAPEAQPPANLYEEANRRLFASIARASVTGKGFLFYYRPDSEERRKGPLGFIDLLAYKDIEVSTARPHSFLLRTEDQEYVIAANSEEESKKWIEEIKRQADVAKGLPSVEKDEKYVGVYSKLVSRDFHKQLEEVADKAGALTASEGEILSASDDNEPPPEDAAPGDGSGKAKDASPRRAAVLGLFNRKQSREGAEKAVHGDEAARGNSEGEDGAPKDARMLTRRLSLGVPNIFKRGEKASADEHEQTGSAEQEEKTQEVGETEKAGESKEERQQHGSQGHHNYAKFLDRILHGKKENAAEEQAASGEAAEPAKEGEAAAPAKGHEERENTAAALQRTITRFFRRHHNVREEKPSSDDEHTAAAASPEAAGDGSQAQTAESPKEAADAHAEAPAEDTEGVIGVVTKTTQTLLRRLTTMARRHHGDAPANLSSDGEGEDIPSSLDVSQAAKSGYLQKQALVIRNYERRFFVLHKDGQLHYYRLGGKDGEDTKQHQPTPGSLPSHKTIVLDANITVSPVTDTKKPHAFEIVTKLRSFRLAATSDAERDEWIAAIEAVKAGLGAGKAGSTEVKKGHSSTPELPEIVPVSEIADDDGNDAAGGPALEKDQVAAA